MKYGETLRQRSIPAWSHHNIDYDDIKYFIKERTTPGKGKTVSIPGRGDEKLLEFEAALFHILQDQHQRIGLFVKSKAGEIRRRLDHVRKQLKRLSSRRPSVSTTTAAAAAAAAVPRLERYGQLENDVLKAGDEIRSLARFTGTQRTAFRKLLKKYKKWTGSTSLENRFRDDVLDDPKSFTRLDLGPLLDDYSETLQRIRGLYEVGLQHARSRRVPSELSFALASSSSLSSSSSSAIDRLHSAIRDRSMVDFDTAIATVPRGEGGACASYFVHPENVVELQVLLLQHMRFYASRSRSNSVAAPVSLSPQHSHPVAAAAAAAAAPPSDADCHLLVADRLDRFAQEQSALTVDEREHAIGSMPQRAKLCARWNNDEDAVLAARVGAAHTRTVSLKKKHVDHFFDRNAGSPPKTARSAPGDVNRDLAALRGDVLKDAAVRPLYRVSSCRSRLVGINNGHEGLLLAVLDTGVTMRKVDRAASAAAEDARDHHDFPFAVLQIRKEGAAPADLVAALDDSHLVERVRGFSMQYHALWQTCRPANLPPPFWLPMLSQDIRKLPPPALTKRGSLAGDAAGLKSPSATQHSASTNSLVGVTTDSTTAVETARPSSSGANVPDQLEAAPLRSFRKKRRRRQYPPADAAAAATEREAPARQQRYWSEYDHPEDGDEGEGYVIYIDPDEPPGFLDRVFDRFARFFSSSSSSPHSRSRRDSQHSDEYDPLLSRFPRPDDKRHPPDASSITTPTTTTTTSSSSSSSADGREDERGENDTLALESSSTTTTRPHYGTISSHHHNHHHIQPNPPQLAATPCLLASLTILLTASLLASASRRGHRFARRVHAAVLLAAAASLVFAAVGVRGLWRRRRRMNRARTGVEGRQQHLQQEAKERAEAVGWMAWGFAGFVVCVDVVGVAWLVLWVFGGWV